MWYINIALLNRVNISKGGKPCLQVSYNVIADIDIIDQAFGEDSPFRLKSDARKHKLTQDMLNIIARDLADEMKAGFDTNTCNALHWTPNRKGNYAKIRAINSEQNFGKSKGYRCIVLCDMVKKEGYLLHIFEHADKDNLSPTEKRALNKLVDEYIKALYK